MLAAPGDRRPPQRLLLLWWPPPAGRPLRPRPGRAARGEGGAGPAGCLDVLPPQQSLVGVLPARRAPTAAAALPPAALPPGCWHAPQLPGACPAGGRAPHCVAAPPAGRVPPRMQAAQRCPPYSLPHYLPACLLPVAVRAGAPQRRGARLTQSQAAPPELLPPAASRPALPAPPGPPAAPPPMCAAGGCPVARRHAAPPPATAAGGRCRPAAGLHARRSVALHHLPLAAQGNGEHRRGISCQACLKAYMALPTAGISRQQQQHRGCVC